ncbi:MAG: hypothetical protein KGV44_08500 [Flavobacteriaceae bacterium]|nr:hypothetical protein [Flavobacteriaceae bacterium]
MINFNLKNINEIVPWGEKPNLNLHWFGLTDGNLWLNFGNETIYEYSEEVLNFWGDKSTPYNDYYVVRFLEDFTACFHKIGISIPYKFYKLTKNINQFKNDTEKWLENNEDSEIYWQKYCDLISWISDRSFDSGHLIGGPVISFFRYRDKIRIVWVTEWTLENGIQLWKAKDGGFEMNYSEFVSEVRKFGQDFFNAMDKQIELALSKDWGDIEVDKKMLVKEHAERKLDFAQKISFLEKDRNDDTDWNDIENILKQMKKELNK